MNTEIVKKKRGRKPKPKSLVPKVVKKRGRKPKPKSHEELNKIPKKRGRKPNKIINNEEVKINEEPIILHLPIKDTNNDIYIPKPFIDLDNFNSEYKNILENTENNVITEIKDLDKDMNLNTISKYNKLCKEYENIIHRDKVIPIFLEYNDYNKKKKWPNSINISCLWCCHNFKNFPFGIPIKKVKDTYHMFGNFCSPECAAAYNFDNNNTYESYERYSMLNYLYSNTNKIKLAGPKLSLKLFGGQLSINEFRNNSNIYNKNYKLLLPPMISVIPMIEEINIFDVDITNDNRGNLVDINHDDLKLKRMKPLPDSCNTLENCMNLKLV